jgi:outer membrane lipoprotein SlyB
MADVRLSSGLVAACGVLASLAGCAPSFSPNTYDAGATQKANKVEQGVIVGVRTVQISADATLGTVTGGAAGGIGGAQAGVGVTSAFTALGGTVIGGLVGNATAHAVDDTIATEYIVKQTNGDLVSVTQKDKTPLPLGQHVLVITGNQARVVADYTVPATAPTKAAATPPNTVAVPLATTSAVPTLAPTTQPPVPVIATDQPRVATPQTP